ncbi:hypothetical protein HYN59_12700 [Flavobacterium album]|uniref:Uncharacterized protein n=1 Tax=Flavobacterium album TaxID=2175091 RepID=A0A2S1R065_9FLAO|nr:hypothetical protein [Flavobacterium album]AWH85911.1 hypothetical protein HYN59_12700 [Flavobacterium album]
MPYYKALFRMPGGRELEAHHGYVPNEFFNALQQVTEEDIVAVYEDGFVLSNEMHDKLDRPGTYTSYAAVGIKADEGFDKMPGFGREMLKRLKIANHARPLADNLHYQVFYIEHIETPPDDD